MYFESFCFMGELGVLICDDICKCVVNMQFELHDFVFDSVYVDLQYDEIYLTFTVGSVCMCCGCGGYVDCDACTVCEASMLRVRG